MEEKQRVNVINIVMAATYIGMVTVNALANTLPINGVNTGQVSDSYPNLFAPAGITFAIWGVIYLLLAFHTAYQLGMLREGRSTASRNLLQRIGVLFAITSVINGVWIFMWHYRMIPATMILMLALLVCLAAINLLIRRETLTVKEKFFIRLPFSIYFGWITVATIANTVVLLVSLDWDGFGIGDSAWAVFIIATGMLIGTATMLFNKDMAYGLVLIWAYAGILIKHISAAGFNKSHLEVIITVTACLIIFLGAEISLIGFTRKKAEV